MNAGQSALAAHPIADELSLSELLTLLWSGHRIILGCTLLALLLGGFYVWLATPIYQVEALLLVGAKQVSNKGGPALEAKVEGLLEASAQPQAEIEILQSNQVLSRAVEALHLDLVITPTKNRVIGTVLSQERDAPRLEVESLDLPEVARGQKFSLEVQENGTFDWRDPDGKLLAQGKVGAKSEATWQGQPISLKVKNIVGKPGQSFSFRRQFILESIQDIRKNLSVIEKGKETNILCLTLQYPDPMRGSEILNAILDQYIRESVERKTEEAAKTLAFLQQQISILRDKSKGAEQLLNQFRAGSRSADLGEEAKLALQRSVAIESQTLELRQKREDLLRTYQPHSDVVATLDQQIAKLQGEGRRLDAHVKSLPRTQQEVMRLSRDVQVNQERYGALLNLEALNIQQLQMAKVGEIGNARIVDPAIPSLNPVKPQKVLVISLGMLMGALFGIGLVLLRRALHRGVEDPQVLAAQFDLPVLATIPHSINQADLTRQSRKSGGQIGLLTTTFPGDWAVESLRSLRTSLDFTLVDAPNRAIMIAGSSPGIGKSFVSINFAAVLAQSGAQVLLVDADMRKGKLHRHFGAKARMEGLSEVLVGRLAWRDVLHHAHGLDMISTGTLPPNPSGLLYGKRFAAFMAEVCTVYDYVVIDAPPVLVVTDAAIIGAHVGAVLLLLKGGQHPLSEIRASLHCLDIAGIRAKGFIFNDMTPQQSSQIGYHRYAYGYGYQG